MCGLLDAKTYRKMAKKSLCVSPCEPGREREDVHTVSPSNYVQSNRGELSSVGEDNKRSHVKGSLKNIQRCTMVTSKQRFSWEENQKTI